MDAEPPRKNQQFQIGQALDALSIGELEEITAQLGAEIDRLNAKIATKKADLDAAQSLFKG